jgi:hypothetical protein
MKPRFLLPEQPVTVSGERPSAELVEIVQRLAVAVGELQGRLDALNAVASPIGGGTVDAEARAAIDAIRGV